VEPGVQLGSNAQQVDALVPPISSNVLTHANQNLSLTLTLTTVARAVQFALPAKSVLAELADAQLITF
jgi:hypothetical protein